MTMIEIVKDGQRIASVDAELYDIEIKAKEKSHYDLVFYNTEFRNSPRPAPHPSTNPGRPSEMTKTKLDSSRHMMPVKIEVGIDGRALRKEGDHVICEYVLDDITPHRISGTIVDMFSTSPRDGKEFRYAIQPDGFREGIIIYPPPNAIFYEWEEIQ